MTYPVSRVKTWVNAETLTHTDQNAEFDNVLTNVGMPENIDDYSANVAEMQTTADPGESGTESLATTLAGEIARLRFIIKEITNKTYWYQTPTTATKSPINAEQVDGFDASQTPGANNVVVLNAASHLDLLAANDVYLANDKIIYQKDAAGVSRAMMRTNSVDNRLFGDLERASTGYLYLSGATASAFHFVDQGGNDYTGWHSGNDGILSGLDPDFAPTNTYHNIFNWFNSAIYASAFTGGAAAYDFHQIKLSSGAGSGNFAVIGIPDVLEDLFFAGKRISIEWLIKRTSSVDVVTNYAIATDGAIGEIADTQVHFGFKIANNAIYASNADGGTATQTDTGSTIASGNVLTRLKAVYTVGTDVKYYVDGVLKATHTTNLSGAVNDIWIETKTNEAVNKDTTFGKIVIEVDY